MEDRTFANNGHTLLLSQSYEPIKIIGWQRALTLLFLGKVEILESHDRDVRSTTFVIKMPAVARLLHALRLHRKPVKFSRSNIYGRDGYKCQYCGEKKGINELTYDHVVPRAQGGKTEWANIVAACSSCNARKGGRTPEQAGMKLLKKPKRPEMIPQIIVTLSKDSIPAAWRDYVYWCGSLEQD